MSKTTTGALGTTGTMVQSNSRNKCDGCKRALKNSFTELIVKGEYVYTCNCGVASTPPNIDKDVILYIDTGIEELISKFKPLTEKEELLIRIAYKQGQIKGLSQK